MTDDLNDKGLRILLEALTTISYLKGGDGRAAAIAEYALDHYGKAIRNADVSERDSATQACFPGQYPESCDYQAHRRVDRRRANGGPPCGQTERRHCADRRVSPDRRSDLKMHCE